MKMNYLDDRRIARRDIKSGWILVAVVNLGFAALTL